jgi:multiple sugar transport system permease protein
MVKQLLNQSFNMVRAMVLLFFMLFTIFPFYWMFVTSVKTRKEIYSGELTLWPKQFTWGNYIDTIQNTHFFTYFTNSLLVTMVSSLVVLFVSVMGGYSMSRYRFKGKKLVLLVFLGTQMIPTIIILVPLFILYSKLNMLNHLSSLIVTYTVINIPFCLITMSSFFQRIPVALEEAALIDGCNKWKAMALIILPLMLPGIVATFVFAFTGAWNELFFGIMFINGESAKTIPVGLINFVQKFDINWGQMSAGGMMSLIPVMVIFAIVQKYIISGLTQGAVKG